MGANFPSLECELDSDWLLRTRKWRKWQCVTFWIWLCFLLDRLLWRKPATGCVMGTLRQPVERLTWWGTEDSCQKPSTPWKTRNWKWHLQSSQTFRWLWPLSSLIATSWETLGKTAQLICSPISSPTETVKIINVYCFKLLSLGLICCATINNCI